MITVPIKQRDQVRILKAKLGRNRCSLQYLRHILNQLKSDMVDGMLGHRHASAYILQELGVLGISTAEGARRLPHA